MIQDSYKDLNEMNAIHAMRQEMESNDMLERFTDALCIREGLLKGFANKTFVYNGVVYQSLDDLLIVMGLKTTPNQLPYAPQNESPKSDVPADDPRAGIPL